MLIRKLRFPFCSIPAFKSFRLNPKIEEYLTAWELHTPTPVQDLVIPGVLKEKRDYFFMAGQTGQGKTLAYIMPIVHEMAKSEGNLANRPRCVILVPSKELVSQVFFKSLGFYKYFGMKIVGLTGYQTIQRQKQLLDEGADFVVTTLDRLEKHVDKKNIFLSQLRFMVIDEADTFLDAGFRNEIEKYIHIIKNKNINHEIKTKLFFVGATYTGPLNSFFLSQFGPSAKQYLYYSRLELTMKKWIEKKTHLNLQNLTHEFVHINQLDKYIPLLKLLQEEIPLMDSQDGSMMLFTNSISCCQALEYKLIEQGIPCVSLHGDVPKKSREQNFKRFRDREIKILLSTDLGSRGLDFTFLTHVVNFDYPRTNSDYLHRAGRAGRAGRKGKVLSLYHQKDLPFIKTLQQAFENDQPVDIKGSAYSKINKEILKRQQELVQLGESNEISEFKQQKLIQHQGRQIQLRTQIPTTKKEKERGFIPEINRDDQTLKKYRKVINRSKKHERNANMNKFRHLKWAVRKVNRKKQRESLKK